MHTHPYIYILFFFLSFFLSVSVCPSVCLSIYPSISSPFPLFISASIPTSMNLRMSVCIRVNIHAYINKNTHNCVRSVLLMKSTPTKLPPLPPPTHVYIYIYVNMVTFTSPIQYSSKALLHVLILSQVFHKCSTFSSPTLGPISLAKALSRLRAWAAAYGGAIGDCVGA